MIIERFMGFKTPINEYITAFDHKTPLVGQFSPLGSATIVL